MLDDMIRDRLVRGINDEKIQQTLLIEPKLTLAKVTQLAQASELAKQDPAEINKESRGGAIPRDPVNKLSSSSMKCNDRDCHRCKGTHSSPKCPFKDAICHGCGKKGHIKKACRTKKQPGPSARTNQMSHQRQQSESQTGHTYLVEEKLKMIERSTACLRSLIPMSNPHE